MIELFIRWSVLRDAVVFAAVVGLVLAPTCLDAAADNAATETYVQIKAALDTIPAIDTHDHLHPLGEIPHRHRTPEGEGMTLYSVWAGTYLSRIQFLTPWKDGEAFDDWWGRAEKGFHDVRATSFYRYMLPAFRDLYGVEFDSITLDEARRLSERIFANYQNDDWWVREVVTNRANIELMFIDPFWERLKIHHEYQFSVPVLRVDTWITGSHAQRFNNPSESPYEYARKRGLPIDSLDDYLAATAEFFSEGRAAGAACLKTGMAYRRDLDFHETPREAAQRAFGRPPNEVSAVDQIAFEDYMFWQLCRLSAQYDLPFQIHTGNARVRGSNPLLLLEAIESHPQTKFILFHGGYPWVSETGAIAMRYHNVWIDSNWLPQISYTMAKRAYHEWLEVVPSNRILWGCDNINPEGIYGAAATMRRCLAEVLAEKVDRGELREEHAIRIGRQILRENALELFPRIRRKLWRENVNSAAASNR